MPLPYLDPASATLCDQVRRALDVELLAADLPDATIKDPINLAAAEDWLERQLPDPTLLDAQNLARVVRGGIRYLAALIAPSLPSEQRAGDRDVVRWVAPVNRERQAKALLALAEAEVQAVLATLANATDSTTNLPTQFVVAPGTRGR